jgi:hypothetical protein
VERSEVVGNDAELFFEFTSRGIDGLFIRSPSTAWQVEDPAVEWIPVLASQKYVITIENECCDRERRALVDHVVHSRAVWQQNLVVHQRDTALVDDCLTESAPSRFA